MHSGCLNLINAMDIVALTGILHVQTEKTPPAKLGYLIFVMVLKLDHSVVEQNVVVHEKILASTIHQKTSAKRGVLQVTVVEKDLEQNIRMLNVLNLAKIGKNSFA